VNGGGSVDVDSLRDLSARLAWSLWTELGAAGWERRHANWCVELEPLIAFTPTLGEGEPRILREAIDWCAKNERFVSLSQLRHRVRADAWPADAVARFGASVASITRRGWPGASSADPYAVTRSGKSGVPDLRRPSLLTLRLRALFGVGTRAEVVRVMMTGPDAITARQLAEQVAYTRRQVELDVDMLVLGGLVRRDDWSRPATYSLADRAALERVTGHPPPLAPRWPALLRSVAGLLEVAEAMASARLRAPEVELDRRLRALAATFGRAGLEPPVHESRDLDDLLDWGMRILTALAQGDHSVLRADTVMVSSRVEISGLATRED
jgi:hypothetical protein